jgi:protocatechuate 3,4-dioxygenase beta subunit
MLKRIFLGEKMKMSAAEEVTINAADDSVRPANFSRDNASLMAKSFSRNAPWIENKTMKKTIPLLLALLLSAATFASPQIQQRPAGQNAQQLPAAKATIEGTVSRADSGQPLKGARVTLQASARAQSPLLAGLAGAEARALADTRALASLAAAVATVTTDANGRFTFTGVDPGQYQISAERDGFVRSQYGQRTPTGNGIVVPVSANQHLMIDLKMLQASVVSGRIINADGEPAAQATVQAYSYQYSNGQRTLAEVKNVQTNDLGEYRLFWLAPGEYFVSVTNNSVDDASPVGVADVGQGRGGRSGAGAIRLLTAIADRGGPIVQAFTGNTTPPVFYPGTIDPDGAIPITVPASVEVRGMDFQLRPMRTATVSGRVVAPFPLGQDNNTNFAFRRGAAADGAVFALANAPVQLSLNRVGNSQTGLAGLINLRLGSTPVNADGTFEMKGVAPGEYNLTATARDPSGQQYTARTRISVGSSDVTNVTVTARPGVEVRGKIILDGTPPQQFSMSNLRVSLLAEDAALPGVVNLVGAVGAVRTEAVRAFLPGGQAELAEVAADGSFTLRDVGAMQYRVRVNGLPQGAYIQTGRIDTADALNAPFTVDNPGSQLQLQIGFSPGRVSGTISDDRGTAAPGVQAVLVPDESRRGRNDAYFAATTDANGQYAFTNVPPGRYKLFAWEDIPAGAYQYPDFIRRYEERGQSITVNANGAITADARLIPAN